MRRGLVVIGFPVAFWVAFAFVVAHEGLVRAIAVAVLVVLVVAVLAIAGLVVWEDHLGPRARHRRRGYLDAQAVYIAKMRERRGERRL